MESLSEQEGRTTQEGKREKGVWKRTKDPQVSHSGTEHEGEGMPLPGAGLCSESLVMDEEDQQASRRKSPKAAFCCKGSKREGVTLRLQARMELKQT